MADEMNKTVKRVCVTGAAGYIGSWLVKNLLQSGYTVNATLRDPGDATKSGPLLRLAGAQDRLHLFKADLCEEGSFDSAVEACEGVFHVASPMGFTNNSLEDFVVPAVKGVLNVLKACSKAKSVSRVVFTSSVGAASPLNGNGEVIHSCLDESCWTPLDIFKSKPSQITMYMTAKTLAEQEALKYGTENGLEVVSIGPGTVAGPWLTHIPPFSSAQTILAVLGENDKFLEALNVGQGILGSLPFVHIDDVCNAHIFLMEQPNVEGRHICSVQSLTIQSLRNLLFQRYPEFMTLSKVDNHVGNIEAYVPASSKKLEDMGFSYKYGLEKILDETIECAIKHGILEGRPSSSSRETILT